MKREVRLGIFVVATLLILAVGVFLIGGKQSMFKPTYRLKSDFKDVAGLLNGSEVRVGGIREGTVKKIQLPQSPDGKVTVIMDVDNSTRAVLKKDSVATIQTDGLLGDKFLDVSFGSKDAAPVHDGDTIEGQPTLDISDLIKKTNDLLDNAKGSLENVQATTSNLEAISNKINNGKGTVGALINDPTMYRKVEQGASAFADDMEALKHNFLLRGFFKKRGYEDAEDLTKHSVAKLPPQQPIQRMEFAAGQIFDKPDGSKLKHDKALDQAGQYLQANKYGLVVVAALGGPTGDSEKLRQLTEAQSAAVRDYLVQNFRVDDQRIKTIGLGKAQENEDGNKVEVLVYGPNTQVPKTSAAKR